MSRTFCEPAPPTPPSRSAVRDGVLDPRDPDPTRLAALRDWLRLQSVFALCPERVVETLRRERAPAAALASCPAPGRSARPAGPASLSTVAESGCVALPLLAPIYPSRLAVLADPPLLLLVRGDLAALEAPAVAIVGARAATAYGLRVARELARALADAGVAVVSGLARGVDAAAHEGALQAGGRTIAVQACGPDQVYPREHAALAERISASGALLTELPPGAPPRAPFFPLRNRIISALSRVVVVVEARPRSGSLITARHGADQGVDVMAVPGPIDKPTSSGTNRLIAEGAWPVLEPADVLLRLGMRAAPREAPRSPRSRSLSAEALELIESLDVSPAAADELARRLVWPAERVARVLCRLELDGLVSRDRDGRWLACARSPGR